jgi:hypothetical protein
VIFEFFETARSLLTGRQKSPLVITHVFLFERHYYPCELVRAHTEWSVVESYDCPWFAVFGYSRVTHCSGFVSMISSLQVAMGEMITCVLG